MSNAPKPSVISFDGIDDYLVIANHNSINFDQNQNFCIELWLKIGKISPGSHTPFDVNIFEKWQGSVFPYAIRYSSTAGTVYGSRYDGRNPSISSKKVINDQKFHHVAFVKQDSQLFLYVDGVKESETQDTVIQSTKNDSPLYIAAGTSISKGGGTRRFFAGQIADIRLWNIARTPEEIKQNMNSRLRGNEPGLVGYYPLNGDANDKTSNANHGTINGAIWQQEEIPVADLTGGTEVKADTTPVVKIVGRIVVNADESTLSDQGIKNGLDAATFALNIAKYFVGENKGKFHVLSNNFGLTGASLEQTMTKAGHTWTKGMNIPINLETLEKYDGIFIGGDLVDNQVLIEYVKNGGKVYLCAGTGQGGAQAEANNWNTFLAAFGLKIQGIYNAITGNIAVDNPNHPLFAGVKTLYQNNGNFITDLQTDSQLNQIILAHSSGKGLIGTAEFVKASAPKSPA